MGIGRPAFNLYNKLQEKSFFNNIKSVIELGSQEIHVKNKEDLRLFLKSIGRSSPDKDIKEAYAKLGKRELKKRIIQPDNLPGKIIYQWLGIRKYESIDSDGIYVLKYLI